MSTRETVATLVKLGRANAMLAAITESHRLMTLGQSAGYMAACKEMAEWMRKEMDKPAPEDLVNKLMEGLHD